MTLTDLLAAATSTEKGSWTAVQRDYAKDDLAALDAGRKENR